MRILVTGSKGQLGYDVVLKLKAENIECLGIDIEELDITDCLATHKYILEYNPSVVIHCAAYTAVDKAEDNQEICYRINVVGTKNIAEACKEIDASLVYISTDYVFSGTGHNEYEPEDKPEPINYYGKTKYEGELEVARSLYKFYIIRTSWVYGLNGNNFVKTMLNKSIGKQELKVVNDQFGSPTYTYDLACLISDMIKTEKYGIYHATNEGICSWKEFAEEVFHLGQISIQVIGIPTSEYPTRAERPLNSRLSKEKLEISGLHRLPEWKDSLKKYLVLLNHLND